LSVYGAILWRWCFADELDGGFVDLESGEAFGQPDDASTGDESDDGNDEEGDEDDEDDDGGAESDKGIHAECLTKLCFQCSDNIGWNNQDWHQWVFLLIIVYQ